MKETDAQKNITEGSTQQQTGTPSVKDNTRDVTQRFVYPDDRDMERPFDFKQLIRLLGYMRPYQKQAMLALGLTVCGAAASLTTPYLIKLTLDLLEQSLKRSVLPSDIALLNSYALGMLGCYIVLILSGRTRIMLTNWVGQQVLRDVRKDLFAHVEYLSFNFFDRRSAGSILVRIINDVNALQELFTNGVVQSLMDILLLFGIATIMFGMHVQLTLVSLLVLPFMVLISTRMRRQIRRGWREVRVRSARINAHLNEAIQGMRVTEAFVQERENQAFFRHMNNDYRETFNRSSKVGDLFNPLVIMTGGLGVATVYWYGSILYQHGVIPIGTVYAFAAYLNRFWEPISRLGNMYNQMLQAMASSERIFEFLDTKSTVHEKSNAPELPQITGEVEFRQVSFAYSADRPALHEVSLQVSPGKVVALVGPTGSGKTTIVNLLSRFYDVTSGSVLIDGHDVRDVSLRSLRSQIGIVLQDTFLFSGTVIENIRFGRLDATDEEVIAAAKAIGADEFIEKMTDGYQTFVNERGSGISLGQRQMLSFARAVLADPRILILDEATASIDTETEQKVQAALAKLLKGRTAFVVAHRLSTIRNADLIIVLDHGNIVEKGNHETLVGQPGLYRDLVEAQFRLLA